MIASQHCGITGCDVVATQMAKVVETGTTEVVVDVSIEDVFALLSEGKSVPLCRAHQNKMVQLAKNLAEVR